MSLASSPGLRTGELLPLPSYNAPTNKSRNATREWLMETQITKEYYKEYFAITEPMFIKPREFAIYDTMGPPYVVFKKSSE